jgi:predicted regulator of Ras-like GTPase activity (Roadblock/LC7/MglB family)
MREVLREVMKQIPEFLGAAVIGLDGIPVEKLAADDAFNIELASAEGIGVVRRAATSLRDLPGEPLEEITITSPSRLTILRALGPEYFLCVVVGRGSLSGRARYEVWKAGHQIREVIG